MLWYLFLVAMVIRLTFRRNKLLGVSIIVALAVFAWLATEYIPTLRNRVGYFNYTYILVNKGEISTVYSDMNRLISYDISARLIKEHPLTGVGAGDIMDEMQKGYDKLYPGTSEELKILPHNQFLTIGLAAGIPAMLLFIAWVFAPLKHIRKNRDGFFFFIVWLVLFLPMLVEPMLEIQYGVFVYLFFLLWQRHMLVQGREA
jgi:O-antigen ligase